MTLVVLWFQCMSTCPLTKEMWTRWYKWQIEWRVWQLFNKYTNSNLNLPMSTCGQKREFQALLYSSKGCKKKLLQTFASTISRGSCSVRFMSFRKNASFSTLSFRFRTSMKCMVSTNLFWKNSVTNKHIYNINNDGAESLRMIKFGAIHNIVMQEISLKQYSNIINLTTAFNQLWRIQPPVRCWSKQPLVIWKQCLK